MSYPSGAALERRVKEDLEDRGWFAVRSAGSHGPADVMAARNDFRTVNRRGVRVYFTRLLLVQVRKDGYLLPSERQGLLDAARKAGGLPVVTYRPSPRTLAYALLTGPGPKDRQEFDPGPKVEAPESR